MRAFGAGGGTDARNVSPMNPWLSIYYMVTGRNSAGELINEGQLISREEALGLYTRDNAWFIAEEEVAGFHRGRQTGGMLPY